MTHADSRSTCSARTRYIFLLVFFAACASISLAPAQTVRSPSGVDCECSLIGNYIKPDIGVNISVNEDSTSPHNKYAISISGTGPYDLQVIRLSDHTTMLDRSVDAGTFWGFSPDDDRFVVHYASGGIHIVNLYDLSAGFPAPAIWSSSVSTLSSRILFSAHGRYLMYEAINGSFTTYFYIVNAVTGVKSFEDTYIFYNIPDSSDEYGMSTHGFSPDTSDRTFSYAYIYGQNEFMWNVVNLQTASYVKSEQHNGISEFWQFSPCGEVLGDVRQLFADHVEVRLLKTVNGGALTGSSSYPLAGVNLRSTVTSHIANVGGTDYVLAPNSAGGVCITVPETLQLDQHRVIAGVPVNGSVTINTPAQSGGFNVQLSSSHPSAASVPSTITVLQNKLSQTFTVATHVVALPETVVISGSANGTTKRDTLVVLPQGVATVKMDPPGGVMGGDSALCTVTLTNPAPNGGLVVNLTNSNPGIASIPASVTVPQSSMSKSFIVHTDTTRHVDSTHITAQSGPTSASVTFIVAPFATINCQPDSIVGGNSSTLFVTMYVPAPVGGRQFYIGTSDSVIGFAYSPLYVGTGLSQAYEPARTTGVALNTAVVFSILNAPYPTQGSLLVRPANLQSFTSLPDYGCLVGMHNPPKKNFIAGNPIAFSMSLDGEAPPLGASITMTSVHKDILPLSSPTLLPYHSWGTKVTLSSNEVVTSPQQVVITLSYRGKFLRDTVTIFPRLHYHLIEFGDSTYDYTAMGVTNAGKVLANGSSGMYFWNNGQITPLNSYPGFHLYSNDVSGIMNDSGHIVGNVGDHAAYWKPDTTIVLPDPPGFNRSSGRSINNLDDVVGTTDTSNYGLNQMGVLWRGDATLLLDSFGSLFRSYPNAVNNSRQVVGEALRDHYPYDPSSNALLWENGHITWSVTGGNYQYPSHPILPSAYAINDSGTIAGEYYLQPAYVGQGWFIRHGTDTINYPSLTPFYGMRPLSMNASGVIVVNMWYDDFETSPIAFMFRDGFYYDLNCMTDSLPNTRGLSMANSINDRGIIAGAVHIYATNTTRPCILVPAGLTVGVKDIPAKRLPLEFTLRQNFPNPFNPATTIKFELPKASNVSLKVFNVLGQQVIQLVSEERPAGVYTVSFDGQNLATGVYFYRLEAGSFADVKKMMIIK